jgi:hypothetical protein
MEPPPEAPEAPAEEPVVVTYEQGALAITAHDASLRDILQKVREATGATIDAPISDQRMTVQLAPQAPVETIAALLDGMHMDYAVAGGTTVQDPVRRVILTWRMAPGHVVTAAATPPPMVRPLDQRPLDPFAGLQRSAEQIRLQQNGNEEGLRETQAVPGPGEIRKNHQ